MRAARALAGFKSVADLAQAIPSEADLGERTLRKFESGESELRPPVMREIAAACRLPYEFFSVDFTRLGEIANADRLGELHETLLQIEARLATLEAEELAPSGEGSQASRPSPKGQQ